MQLADFYSSLGNTRTTTSKTDGRRVYSLEHGIGFGLGIRKLKMVGHDEEQADDM